MATFDWEVTLKTAYRDHEEALSKFREACSDTGRVSLCSRQQIWSDESVCRFIKRCVEASCTETSGKSDELSVSWRERGNVWFKKGRYKKAISSYTQSVQTAPYNLDGESKSDGVPLAMAFGNRSAALYHLGRYELAIQECDRAINYGYPKETLHKILLRKEQCLVKMGQCKQASSESLRSEMKKLPDSCSQSGVDKTTSSKPEEPSTSPDKLEGASRSVDLRICKDRGRYLVADLPVIAGELLIKETPYAVVLLPEYHSTHCHQCCRRTLNPVPCPECANVQYCSDQCLRSAWDSHHWLECGLWEGLIMFGTRSWLSLRLLLHARSWLNAKRVAEEARSQQTSSTSVDPQTSAIKMAGGNSTPREAEVKSEEETSLNVNGKQHPGKHPQTSQAESANEEAEPRSAEPRSAEPRSAEPRSAEDAFPERPQNSKVANVGEGEGEDEVERINRTLLPGCDQAGCYRSDYRAVYHLMPHTENHSNQQLFNMTITSLLLSKCIHEKLLNSTRWMHQVQNASASSTVTAFGNHGNPRCLQRERKIRRSTTQDEGTVKNTDGSRRSEAELKGDRRQPGRNQLDENRPSIVCETAAFLLRHLQQLTCNSHAVTTIQTSEDINSLSNVAERLEPTESRPNQHLNADTTVDTTVDRRNDIGQRGAEVDTTKQIRLATAIYPTASLLNHSCQPNVIASFDGAVLTIRATTDIQPGEEILHCYGPHAKHMSRDERRIALQEQYFFTCTCLACTTYESTYESRDWFNSFACCKCSYPLVERQGKRIVGVCTNSQCGHAQSLRDLLKEKERTDNLFKLSQHFLELKRVEECLGILHQCYSIQRAILYKHHKALAETQDCLAQCYSHIGNFRTAGKYLRLSIETVEKLYGSESIELANELHKLAQVLFNGGEVQDTLVIVDRAIKLLVVHYGPNHTDVQELTAIKTCLMSL